MSTTQTTAEIRARRLARYAELADSIAEHLHDEILAAETAQDKRDLTLAFHRITRSARQTMALEAKLERDETLDIVAKLAEAEAIAREPVKRRKAQITAAIERLIWHEREDDGVELSLKLNDLMEEDDLHDRYAEGPVEDHIRRLCLALGLAGEKDEILIFPTAPPAAGRRARELHIKLARHGRPCAGHPETPTFANYPQRPRIWIPGTSPGMTKPMGGDDTTWARATRPARSSSSTPRRFAISRRNPYIRPAHRAAATLS